LIKFKQNSKICEHFQKCISKGLKPIYNTQSRGWVRLGKTQKTKSRFSKKPFKTAETKKMSLPTLHSRTNLRFSHSAHLNHLLRTINSKQFFPQIRYRSLLTSSYTKPIKKPSIKTSVSILRILQIRIILLMGTVKNPV
jgi:hypothetical protein